MPFMKEAQSVRDNLVRAQHGAGTMSLRSDPGTDGRTLFGHFSVFNTWYEVNSAYEGGRFLERVAPGAFKQAFTDRSQIRVMFDHGHDPQIGNKPLGTIVDLREDATGAYYEVDLFDATYVNDLIPAMRSDQLGASFRFSIPDGADTWDETPKRSPHNPAGLPERTITGTKLYEFGPVVWGASPAATSGIRSGTDEFIDHFLRDPAFVARFTERAGLATTERILATLPPTAPVADTKPDAPKITLDEIRAIEGLTGDTGTESADGDDVAPNQRRAEWWTRKSAGFVDHIARLKETPPCP